ncbi:MAG: hypothetical protein ACI8RZ_002517 [Myxococcota bacterium]|jgi:hypothetical protein
MILTALLLGCGEEPAEQNTEEETSPPQSTEEAPYLADPDASDSPDFSSDDVGAAVEEALVVITQIDVVPIVSVYDTLLTQTDDTCPLWSDYDGTPLWYDSCVADTGVQFDGYGLASPWAGTDDGSGNIWWGTQLYSIATITDADGQVFTSGGSATSLVGTTADGAELTYNAIEGGFSWDGPEAEGTWLDWGIDPTLVWYSARDPTSGGQVITLSGAITLDEGPIAAVVLDSIYLTDEILGSSCGQEPSGTISLLDSEGRWYDLIFDGPTDAAPEVPEEACDGCATAWYRGTSLGEACVDFSVLRD